ncbi:MAG: glycosyltransferase family 2 protein, partial [Brevinema sp.]
MSNPKVSVIIPVYNVEQYLRECLDSVVNQTLKDIEIIIVNDCSPDNSEQIILEYAEKDPRIVYIKHETNKRQGGARNTGIRVAKGEWIYFMDSDDYIALNLLEKIIHKCESIGANFGLFGRKDFGSIWGGRATTIFKPSQNLNGIIIDDKTLIDIWVAICTRIFKTKDLIDNNLFFEENFFAEDLLFNYQYISLVEPKIAVLSEPLYHYRRHGQSTTGQMSKNALFYPLASMKIVEFLKKNNKWDQYKNTFFKDLPTHIYPNFLLLDQSLLADFIKNIELFCEAVNPSAEDIKQCPLLVFKYLAHAPLDSKKEIFTHILNNHKIENDKWYQF